MRISLVVPLQDEAKTVLALLRSIASQIRVPDELVIVDAGSVDETASLVRRFDAPCPLLLVSADRVFPGVARNLGVERASSSCIAFTDGGIELDADWLRRLEVELDSGGEAVFGSVEPVCNTRFARAAAIAFVSKRDVHGIRGPFVASSAVTREAFQRAGGFPPYRAAEDLIYMERLAQSSRVRYAPEAFVRWQLPEGPSATYRRFRLYSFHNLLAGRERFWHLGVARLYALLTVVILTFLGMGAAGWSGVVVPFFFLARAMKAAVVKRGSLPFETLMPADVGLASAILVLVDCATLGGFLDWLRRGCPRADPPDAGRSAVPGA